MSLRRSTLPILVVAAMLASCKDCDDPKTTAKPDAAATNAAAEAAAPPPVVADASPVDAATTTAPLGDDDAGASACKLAYGPAEQPFRGPAAMTTTGTDLRLIANDSGKPRIYTVALNATTPASPPPSFVGMRWPPCELAGKFVYCQGPGGPITRTTLGANDTKTVVSKSRGGARIAAAPIGGTEHSVVAFLDVRQTTEGSMLQAFVVLDDDGPMRLSEDGAGATTVRMAPRGDAAVAVYLDARTAMVPVHARDLSMKDKDLVLGNDAVAFVGGSPERGVDIALGGATPKDLFVLLPMPRETIEFGMAAIPVKDPPKEDVGATWSLYPNGLDPAPIAVTLDGWVARVRPKEKMPGARRVLELGRLAADGAFKSLGVISEGKAVTDITIVTDAQNGVWILYGDSNATFLERRVCP